MAKKSDHITPRFEFPYDSVAEIQRTKKARLFHAWRLIKSSCGPSFLNLPAGVCPRWAKELVEIGWLRQDKKTRRYYQVKTSKTFKFEEGRDSVFMPRRWNEKDRDALLFHVTNAHYTRIHPAAASKLPEAVIEWRKRADLPTLNPRCEHLDGMALTEVEREVGISIGKGHYLRKRCESEGLSSFTGRFAIRKYCTDLEAHVDGHKGHVFNAYWGTLERLTSEFHCIEPVEFRRISWRKPGRHRVVGTGNGGGRKGGPENYTTGKTLAQYG